MRSKRIINWGNNVFVGVMHTSDVIGDPESRIGNVDVYTNGGRLQPGCYNNENNITECKIDLISYQEFPALQVLPKCADVYFGPNLLGDETLSIIIEELVNQAIS